MPERSEKAPLLSVVILTFNEARQIEACLASAKPFADELMVFDSQSVDATCELAGNAGAKVYRRRFDNYPSQRNAALDAARGDWVLFLDADERATEAVGKEIRAAITSCESPPSAPVLFWIPRRNYIFGKWIRHSGWSPDYQPRLLRKGKARFDPTRTVHELVIADGGEASLREPLQHFNYDTLTQFRAKQAVYTQFEARMLFDQGIRVRWRGLIGQPLREFGRRFFTLKGYKDGIYGLTLSALMAYYAFVRQRMLKQMWREFESRL
jgi:(heptosyl)LPS beta-1,4-glucosyltransferase